MTTSSRLEATLRDEVAGIHMRAWPRQCVGEVGKDNLIGRVRTMPFFQSDTGSSTSHIVTILTPSHPD